MKSKAIMLGVAILLSFAGAAQETETIYSNSEKERPMNTLIKGSKGFGGHISLNVKGTEVYDDAAVLVGGELVFTLGHALNLGMAGYGMASHVPFEDMQLPQFESSSLEMGYGGFFVEPVFFDQSIVHFTVPVLIGGGWSGISRYRTFDNNHDFDYNYHIIDDTGFFVFEPGLNMEVNITRYVKFTLGGTYRMISGSDMEDVSDSDLSGFSISGGFRIGWF